VWDAAAGSKRGLMHVLLLRGLVGVRRHSNSSCSFPVAMLLLLLLLLLLLVVVQC
jgi:hypothetical protein